MDDYIVLPPAFLGRLHASVAAGADVMLPWWRGALDAGVRELARRELDQ